MKRLKGPISYTEEAPDDSLLGKKIIAAFLSPNANNCYADEAGESAAIYASEEQITQVKPLLRKWFNALCTITPGLRLCDLTETATKKGQCTGYFHLTGTREQKAHARSILRSEAVKVLNNIFPNNDYLGLFKERLVSHLMESGDLPTLTFGGYKGMRVTEFRNFENAANAYAELAKRHSAMQR